MKIESLRLHLREYMLCDLSNFHKLKSNTDVWKYSTFTPITSIEEAEKLLVAQNEKQKTDKYGFHALFLKDKETFIGEAGIISLNENINRCEIGYNLIPEFWNTFQIMNVERIEALVLKNNIASCKVLKKSGLILEGTLRHFTKINNSYEDVCHYGMISSDDRML